MLKCMTGGNGNGSKGKASTRHMQPRAIAKPVPADPTEGWGVEPLNICAIAVYASLDPWTAYEGLIDVSLGVPMKIVRKIENGQVFHLQ